MVNSKLTENDALLATTLEAKSSTPPRAASKAERYWFVFDRWLPSASGPEDDNEFVLA